ncbi:T9SS type A sorting domain-containing protein [Mangrovimonas sp. AS39]|uniref:lipocalin-like domain-containing protein n=1 Tax=Mangrovimonas futianensis TaxID=2895523 RepID=UPI001E552B80|nr:lipocalin-like domain-containing protein [Mangrovimonas futianensis]MCF1192021.1 T9SS type A sorting domain-containing protein [Mangrovimonas futianensis]MCF1195715.1 T9SS type A sorting domain-containing protein [Mangrovimonas futianensis]
MKHITTLLLLLFMLQSFAQDWNMYPYEPVGQIAFPLDEGRHDGEEVEWWYTSGFFEGATSGTSYSYMVSYFYYPAAGFDGFRILNITNLDTGTFYKDVLPVTYTTMSTTSLDIEAVLFLGGTETWSNTLDGSNNPIPFEYDLSTGASFGDLTLNMDVTKRPLLVGDDGFVDQGLDRYSYYYSFTGVSLSGSLTLNGTTEAITGTGWLDRQYGNFNPYSSEDYEWFSLQLSNGMDINLWNIFTAESSIPDAPEYRILSAYVSEDNQYTTADLSIEREAFFCTTEDGEEKCYSKQWHLTSDINDVDLVMTAQYEDSEMQLPFRFYEGATTIEGTVNGVEVTGIGFAELLHGYEHPEVAITTPATVFETGSPITWELNNPDDGRPIYYDLSYSVDDQANFLPLVENTTELSYLWESPSISEDDVLYFKLFAYSVDGTLNNEIIAGPFTVNLLSMDEVSFSEVKTYPNPVQDTYYLQFPNVVNGTWQLFDINGRSVSSDAFQEVSLQQIPVSSLSKGVYFLKVEVDSKTWMKKLVKL